MSMFYELMMKTKGMPERYQEVEYIESTGTQYIDTGYVCNPNTKIKTKLKIISYNHDYNAIFGARTSNHSTDTFLFVRNGGTDAIRFEADGNLITVVNLSLNVLADIEIGQNKLTCNGTDYTINMSVIVPNNKNLFLFGLNENGQLDTTYGSASTQIYSFEIYDNNRLVRNFIPVYDTLTQKYGMWESVQGKFYGNDGTGDFGGSIVGYTVVGSPTITDGVVSGFSANDYLQTAQDFPSISDINRVQEQVVFTTGTIGTQQMIMGGDYGAGTFGFELRTNGKLMFRVTYIDVNNATKYAEVQCDTILTENTKYKAIGKFDLSNLSVNLELYNENNVLIDTKTYTISSSSFNILNTVGNYYLGRHWQRGVFTGSIDLNETYIKINNKLWFNGQQA